MSRGIGMKLSITVLCGSGWLEAMGEFGTGSGCGGIVKYFYRLKKRIGFTRLYVLRRFLIDGEWVGQRYRSSTVPIPYPWVWGKEMHLKPPERLLTAS